MKSKTKNTILAVIVSVIAIFVPAFIFGKWIEAVVFFFCHWFIREQFPKQYHHIIPAMCRLITSVVFFFGVSLVLPLGFSLISAVPINYFIGWVGFTKKQADDYEYKCEKLSAQICKKSAFSTDNCTEEELVARCRELNFSEENTQLAIHFFIKKTTRKELAENYSVGDEAIKKKKQRMKDKLNKK